MATKRQEATSVISSFPLAPLTTTFTAPGSRCDGIYFPTASSVFMIDDEPSCLPSGFSAAATDFYYSPGIACPSGYWTACHDTTGAPSITTVTCCPTHGDISLACAPNPQNLRSVWKSLFCTWVAPRAGKVVSATLSLDGRTSTVPVTLTSPEGLNAYGVRMVHQATDLAGLTTTATTATKTTIGTISAAATATATATGGPEPDSGAGLSTGATVAIGVVVPVVVLAALVAGVAWWWRKRRRAPASATSSGSIPAAVPVSVPMEARPTTSIKSSSSAMLQPQELPVPEHLAVEMPSSRLAAELPGDWAHGR